MDGLVRDEPDVGFGPDPLNPHPPRPLDLVGGETADRLRDEVIRSCPRVPGVYGMLNPRGELIYVGKSKSLRSRLLSYFAACNDEEKGGRIIEQTRAIEWETQPSEFAALLREQQLIRRFAPPWNVHGVPQRQRPVYLCLGRAPAAYFYLSRSRPADCIAVEGPFFGAGRMGRAVDSLNKVFRLRDCSQKQVFRFAEQLSLFELDDRPGCLRLEIGTCLGPCVAACGREAYETQVRSAARFLDGSDHSPVDTVRTQMKWAAENRQYELAGHARDTLKSLEYVGRKLALFAKARRDYSFVYPVKGFDGCTTWYLICAGEVTDVAAAAEGASAAAAAAPTFKRWLAKLERARSRRYGENPPTVALVASWFRKHPRELDATFFPRTRQAK